MKRCYRYSRRQSRRQARDPVAEAIRARGTPIIFVTGYGKTAASGLVLAKPYDAAALEGMLNEALSIPHRKSDGAG